jgi:hypothetical protein
MNECEKGFSLRRKVSRILGDTDTSTSSDASPLEKFSQSIAPTDSENVSPLNCNPSSLVEQLRSSAATLGELLISDKQRTPSYDHVEYGTVSSMIENIDLASQNRALVMEVKDLRLEVRALKAELLALQPVKRVSKAHRSKNRADEPTPNHR